MRQTRRKYHLAVRNLKRSQAQCRSEKLAEACLANNSQNFWLQVNRERCIGKTVANIINDCTDHSDIANLFKNDYMSTYQADFVDTSAMETILNDLNLECRNAHWEPFSIEEVVFAVSQLHPNKKDSDFALNSSALINAPILFHRAFTLLLNSCIQHGFIPSCWRTGTIIPLLKAGIIDKSISTNYRPITLSSLFGKIIDILILDRYSDKLASSSLQFGFKKGHSTDNCTFIAKEVSQYYINNGSDVFACALDMKKAFDRVDLAILFMKLKHRQLPCHILRLLFFLYYGLSLRVFWHGQFSDQFETMNGTKQGGILSPILFAIFIDDLLIGLEKLGMGCFVGRHFYGCLAYADDILLLAPTVHALRIMLDYCSQFADNNNILFNPVKSHCIKFCSGNMRVTQYPVQLQGTPMIWCDQITHLGHILGHNLNDRLDIANKINKFCSQTNYFLATFGHITPLIKAKLFTTYCCSFFGSVLWDLCHTDLNTLRVEWRKAVRRIWGLPRQTHNSLTSHLMDKTSDSILIHRFYNFSTRILCHENVKISFIARIASNSRTHTFGKNFQSILYNNPISTNSIPVSPHISAFLELLFCRDGFYAIDNFSHEEIVDLINYLSIN
jgi:Reverse transcriptase (RNA-dependent DNA polymerase)